jgi:MFS family permease
VEPEESQQERVNRELIELLTELRVTLPGVQVLFAFLLSLPFTNRFHEVTGTNKALYIVALVATACAVAFLIAPSVYHRLNFRTPDKAQIVFTGNRFAIAGTLFLALAIGTSLYVVTSFLYGAGVGAGLAAGVAALLAWLWLGAPLLQRRRGSHGPKRSSWPRC